MGYFSNGGDGDDYESRFCERCAHYGTEGGCPVMALHLLYNYDQHAAGEPGETIKAILGELIPRDDKGDNEQCAMFVDADEPEPVGKPVDAGLTAAQVRTFWTVEVQS